MAFDITIPPAISAGVDALSKLPSPSDALSMFGNNIATAFTDAIAALGFSSGADDILSKISQIKEGSPPIHAGTETALLPIESMYTAIIAVSSQSSDMAVHVETLQKSMPLVLKKASTANAMKTATEYTTPECSSNIIFPIGAAAGDATSAVAGTASPAGDILQGDVQSGINDLVAILDTPLGSPGADSYTVGLGSVLDSIIADVVGGDFGVLLAPYAPTQEMIDAQTNITTKGNLIDTTVLAERANLGLPTLAGSPIIMGSPPIEIVPGGDPTTIQMGAGLITADIKKKALGLQAHAMACTPCQKNILARSAPSPENLAGVGSIVATAEEVSGDDEDNFGVQDDAGIEAAEAAEWEAEEAEWAAQDAADVAKIDSFVWESDIYKMSALIYNSEEGLKFKMSIIIPAQSSAMVAKFTELSTVDATIINAEWAYPDMWVMTDFFGNTYIKKSLKLMVSKGVVDGLLVEVYKQYGSLEEFGISIFKQTDADLQCTVVNFIPDPGIVGFNIILSMEDINGRDPTTDTDSEGNCRTVVYDADTKTSANTGPIGDDAAAFWFVKTHVNTKNQFTKWIETGKHPYVKRAAIKYLDSLIG